MPPTINKMKLFTELRTSININILFFSGKNSHKLRFLSITGRMEILILFFLKNNRKCLYQTILKEHRHSVQPSRRNRLQLRLLQCINNPINTKNCTEHHSAAVTLFLVFSSQSVSGKCAEQCNGVK